MLNTMSVKQRAAYNRTLEAEGRTHETVWAMTPHITGVNPWAKRAMLAGFWLGNYNSVTDIGCGNMFVKDCLPPDTIYIPVDIVQRCPSCLVCNLNEQPLPITGTEAVSMLGVLEYCFYPEIVFTQMAGLFKNVVISYNHYNPLYETKAKRASHFWVNNLTYRQFKRMVRNAGFKIVNSKRVRPFEVLYHLEAM